MKSRGQTVANFFGALGYTSVVMQWLWLCATLVIPFIASTEAKQLFLPTNPAERPTPPAEASAALPEWLQLVFFVLAIVFTIGVVVYALVVIPRSIGKAGKAVTQKSAAVVTQHVTHDRKKITKKQRRKLTEYITWSMKLGLLLVPALAALIPTGGALGIDHIFVLLAALFFAGWSLAMFGVQYAIVKLRRIAPEFVW